MRSEKIPAIFLSLIFLAFLSCNPGRQQKENSPRKEHVNEETLMRTNRYLVEKDDERIQRFIERRGWKMTRNNTGLWYQIYAHGSGPKVTRGKKVTIKYTVHLLDGTLCYSSEESGPKTFIAGHGSVERGLEEGILLMRQGDKARLILPPFLAYGVPGDRKMIPPRSVIVYDIEVLKVE